MNNFVLIRIASAPITIREVEFDKRVELKFVVENCFCRKLKYPSVV